MLLGHLILVQQELPQKLELQHRLYQELLTQLELQVKVGLLRKPQVKLQVKVLALVFQEALILALAKLQAEHQVKAHRNQELQRQVRV